MKVTVLVVTYNHEKFIDQAIESVLMQQTDFEYEVVIIEDCSTDRTRDIVIDFQKKNPNRIRLVLAEKNSNVRRACKREILNARGSYIAVLDGDDYWTSPQKLQKQADFLDIHKEWSICFHNTTILYDDNSKKPRNSNPPEQKRISTLEDLLAGNFIPTCSVMFRSGLFESFPSWFDTVWAADWPLHILNAQHGKIGYIDEVMGAYRQHSDGMWNRLSKIQQISRVLEFYEQMHVNLNVSSDGAITRARVEWGRTLLIEIGIALRAGDWKEAFRGVLGLVRYFPEHMLTEFRPQYRPLPLRRYPIIHRLLDGCQRSLRALWTKTQSQASYEGFVDAADCTIISGWAWDSNWPNSPIDIEIWDGRKLLTRLHADRFRRDLLDAGKGNGYHAFHYHLLADHEPRLISVRVAGSDIRLGSVMDVVSAKFKGQEEGLQNSAA